MGMSSRRWHPALLFFGVGVLVGCGDNTLPKYVLLGDLRVLALQAGASGAAAEFSPGDVVTVTPYISDYSGGTRALSYVAKACSDPGVALGVEPSCEGVPNALTVGSGTAATPTTGRTGASTAFSVTVPALALEGRSTRDRFNGVNLLVTYDLSAASGPTVRSFTRIVVSEGTKTTKNNNPQTSDLLSEGATLTAFPTAPVALSVAYVVSNLESFELMRNDLSIQTRTEELLTTWFITDGEVEFFRTLNADTTKYTPPTAAPSGRQPLIVGVTRDSRDAVTVIVREL